MCSPPASFPTATWEPSPLDSKRDCSGTGQQEGRKREIKPMQRGIFDFAVDRGQDRVVATQCCELSVLRFATDRGALRGPGVAALL
jgi:hypothetical protein